MKAAVVWSAGRLSVEDVETPRAEPNELLLRVKDCGICGSDLHASHAMPPGTILGHEFSGEVVEVGREVTGWRPGDRAVALPFFSCGRCPLCRAGDGIHCAEIRGIGFAQCAGAYAELLRIQPENSLRIPAAVSFREAALVEPLAVGLHGLRRSRLQRGETCLILGAGPIGIATMLWARDLGARCLVSELSPGRRELASRLGAAAVIDPATDDLSSAVRTAQNSAPSVVFECVGVKGLIQQAMMLAPLRAQVIVLGVCIENDEIVPFNGILKELSIEFVLGYSKPEFEEALAALASHRLEAAAMITDVIGIDEVPATFTALTKPNAQCKVLIEFE